MSSTPTPLPLQNLVLNGEVLSQSQHYLTWEGVTNDLPLHLEYSVDGQNFEVLKAWQNPINSVSDYTRIDVSNATYYRLVQIQGNNLLFSNIIYLKNDKVSPNIYPNPILGNINFGLPKSQNIRIDCYDLKGQKLWQFIGLTKDAEQSFEKVLKTWSNGTYILKINEKVFRLVYHTP